MSKVELSEKQFMKAILEVTRGPMAGQKRALSGDTSFSIGRRGSNDFKILDKGVSRIHCRVDYDGDYFWLVDCNSHNGTFLNGERVTNSMLYDGDVVTVGHSQLVFRLPEEPDENDG